MAAISEYMDQIQKKARPAYTLTYTSNHGFSKIGGTPDLPSGFFWPECNGVSLPFVAQIDLEEIMNNKPLELLPASGKLYFFYDDEIFATNHSLEQVSPWRVFYFEKDEKVFSTQAPNSVSVTYQEKFVSGTSIQSLPSLERVVTELLHFDEKDMDLLYDTLCDSIETYYNNEPFHQLGGFPIPVKTDTMEEECQKIYEETKKDQKEFFQREEKDKNEWILLLQIDSDDETEMIWGNEGLIYFWIRKKDLAKKNFSNVCMLIDYS